VHFWRETYFKHSDQFRGVIAMSGSYDIYNYLDKGFYDDNVYFNNPAMYLKNLNDDYHLPRLQNADSIVIVSGQGSYEAPDRSRELSDILHSKGIRTCSSFWGHDCRRTIGRGGERCCRIIWGSSLTARNTRIKELSNYPINDLMTA
jgi:esterase/lipase superfamily enzyme